MLIISHREDDTVEISIDRIEYPVVTFTCSGGESFKTRKALIEVFKAMQKDNQDNPQEDIDSEWEFEIRLEDRDQNPNKLFTWYYPDIKIEAPFALDPLEFKSKENGGRSPHTHEALIKALSEIEKDNTEYPQTNRINAREDEDPEKREMIKRIIEKSIWK